MTTVCLQPPAVDRTFRALGTDVRLIAEGFGAQDAIRRAHADVLGYHARLSRFRPESELSRLNADPRTVVPASALLRDAVRAGVHGAERSGGLVDPCLLDALHAVGYRASFVAPQRPVAVAGNGAPRPANPHPAARWRALVVDEVREAIVRPAGLRLDLGGTGKGHAADLVAARLAHLPRWVVSCGGDLRLAGARPVEVTHPLGSAPAATLHLEGGAVATSSVTSRAWLDERGRPAHHLLDPATGRPAWTGILSVTALAASALEAEVLAKTALLRGPDGARRVLAAHGGIAIHADGTVEPVGPVPAVIA